MTFGDHLEVLRKMIIRILAMAVCIGVVVFYFKDVTFNLLLAPTESDFITYKLTERVLGAFGVDIIYGDLNIGLIATDLSSQFMTHITTSVILGLLIASPYVIFELFRFISPALYENERHYSSRIALIIYFLFILGLLMSYFILFPISYRFLGAYSVDSRVKSTITLDSYITTFTTLSFVMGIVFQLPIVAFALGKYDLLHKENLKQYRKHAFLALMLIAAIITPPDIMTLILVTIPLYFLYEISIMVLPEHNKNDKSD